MNPVSHPLFDQWWKADGLRHYRAEIKSKNPEESLFALMNMTFMAGAMAEGDISAFHKNFPDARLN